MPVVFVELADDPVVAVTQHLGKDEPDHQPIGLCLFFRCLGCGLLLSWLLGLCFQLSDFLFQFIQSCHLLLLCLAAVCRALGAVCVSDTFGGSLTACVPCAAASSRR